MNPGYYGTLNNNNRNLMDSRHMPIREKVGDGRPPLLPPPNDMMMTMSGGGGGLDPRRQKMPLLPAPMMSRQQHPSSSFNYSSMSHPHSRQPGVAQTYDPEFPLPPDDQPPSFKDFLEKTGPSYHIQPSSSSYNNNTGFNTNIGGGGSGSNLNDSLATRRLHQPSDDDYYRRPVTTTTTTTVPTLFPSAAAAPRNDPVNKPSSFTSADVDGFLENRRHHLHSLDRGAEEPGFDRPMRSAPSPSFEDYNNAMMQWRARQHQQSNNNNERGPQGHGELGNFVHQRGGGGGGGTREDYISGSSSAPKFGQSTDNRDSISNRSVYDELRRGEPSSTSSRSYLLEAPSQRAPNYDGPPARPPIQNNNKNSFIDEIPEDGRLIDNNVAIFRRKVTHIDGDIGFAGTDLFFHMSKVVGPGKPGTGSLVIIKAERVEKMPFKWNALSVDVVNVQYNNNNNSSLSSGNREQEGFPRGQQQQQQHQQYRYLQQEESNNLDTIPLYIPPSSTNSNLSNQNLNKNAPPLKSILKNKPPPPPQISSSPSPLHPLQSSSQRVEAGGGGRGQENWRSHSPKQFQPPPQQQHPHAHHGHHHAHAQQKQVSNRTLRRSETPEIDIIYEDIVAPSRAKKSSHSRRSMSPHPQSESRGPGSSHHHHHHHHTSSDSSKSTRKRAYQRSPERDGSRRSPGRAKRSRSRSPRRRGSRSRSRSRSGERRRARSSVSPRRRRSRSRSRSRSPGKDRRNARRSRSLSPGHHRRRHSHSRSRSPYNNNNNRSSSRKGSKSRSLSCDRPPNYSSSVRNPLASKSSLNSEKTQQSINNNSQSQQQGQDRPAIKPISFTWTKTATGHEQNVPSGQKKKPLPLKAQKEQLPAYVVVQPGEKTNASNNNNKNNNNNSKNSKKSQKQVTNAEKLLAMKEKVRNDKEKVMAALKDPGALPNPLFTPKNPILSTPVVAAQPNNMVSPYLSTPANINNNVPVAYPNVPYGTTRNYNQQQQPFYSAPPPQQQQPYYAPPQQHQQQQQMFPPRHPMGMMPNQQMGNHHHHHHYPGPIRPPVPLMSMQHPVQVQPPPSAIRPPVPLMSINSQPPPATRIYRTPVIPNHAPAKSKRASPSLLAGTSLAANANNVNLVPGSSNNKPVPNFNNLSTINTSAGNPVFLKNPFHGNNNSSSNNNTSNSHPDLIPPGEEREPIVIGQKTKNQSGSNSNKISNNSNSGTSGGGTSSQVNKSSSTLSTSNLSTKNNNNTNNNNTNDDLNALDSSSSSTVDSKDLVAPGTENDNAPLNETKTQKKKKKNRGRKRARGAAAANLKKQQQQNVNSGNAKSGDSMQNTIITINNKNASNSRKDNDNHDDDDDDDEIAIISVKPASALFEDDFQNDCRTPQKENASNAKSPSAKTGNNVKTSPSGQIIKTIVNEGVTKPVSSSTSVSNPTSGGGSGSNSNKSLSDKLTNTQKQRLLEQEREKAKANLSKACDANNLIIETNRAGHRQVVQQSPGPSFVIRRNALEADIPPPRAGRIEEDNLRHRPRHTPPPPRMFPPEPSMFQEPVIRISRRRSLSPPHRHHHNFGGPGIGIGIGGVVDPMREVAMKQLEIQSLELKDREIHNEIQRLRVQRERFDFCNDPHGPDPRRMSGFPVHPPSGVPTCYVCLGKGHRARDCQERYPEWIIRKRRVHEGFVVERRIGGVIEPFCLCCGIIGHFTRDCRQRNEYEVYSDDDNAEGGGYFY